MSEWENQDQEIVVTSPNRPLIASIAILVLIFWAMRRGSPLFDQLSSSHQTFDSFPYEDFLLFLGGSVLLLFVIIWTLWGEQVVSIRENEQQIVRFSRLHSKIFGRTKSFAFSHIQNMRITQIGTSRSRYQAQSSIGFAIAFDYLGKKQFLVAGLSAEKALSLLKGPLQRFAQLPLETIETLQSKWTLANRYRYLIQALLLGAILLWYFKKQTVSIQGTDLVTQTMIGSLKIGSPHTYAGSDITHMRMEGYSYQHIGRPPQYFYSIVFDYQGQKQTLLSHLSLQHARALLNGTLRPFAHTVFRPISRESAQPPVQSDISPPN